MRSLPGTIVSNSIEGRIVSFFVADEKDTIQRHHWIGEFYEHEELKLIEKYLSPGSTFVDIGANVGNHTIYACLFLGARRAILFEPNPPAIELCRINLALNGLLPLADMSNFGIGLSDGGGRAALCPRSKGNNLGATRLKQDNESGSVQLRSGDDALVSQHVDFIKIDVEGMELRVLRGLKNTIRRDRPTLFIEVDNENALEFKYWLSEQSYRIAERYRRYSVNENLLCVPV